MDHRTASDAQLLQPSQALQEPVMAPEGAAALLQRTLAPRASAPATERARETGMVEAWLTGGGEMG